MDIFKKMWIRLLKEYDDKEGIPLSVVITSASTHNIKAVTDVIDNTVILNRPSESSFTKNKTRK